MNEATKGARDNSPARNDYALREKELQYQTAIETAADGFCMVDMRGHFVEVNSAFVHLTGYSRDELRGMTLDNLNAAETPEQTVARMAAIKQSGSAVFESYCQRKDGSIVPVRVSTTYSNLFGGRFFNFVTDLTEPRANAARLTRANRALNVLSRCNRIMHHAQSEEILLMDACKITVEEGGYYFAWVGYIKNDEGKSVRPVAHAGNENGYLETVDITWADDTERGFGPVGTAIRTGAPMFARDIRNDPSFAPWRDNAIKRGYVSAIVLPLVVDGQTIGTLNIYSAEAESFEDDELDLLTQLANDLAFGIESLRQKAENRVAWEQIRRLAHYDMVTGLPNRALFFDRMKQALATAQREKKRMAVMFIDLDEFKEVNDTLGHNVGDLLLRAVGQRIQSCLRETDTAARFGGDEFLMLLPTIELPDNGMLVAEKVLNALAKPCAAGGHAITVSCSIGIAVYPDAGQDERTLLRHADNAMYEAKNAGRNQARLFDYTKL
jgi:diguanylate cyclase (GGDEF)-like protein/PAS domain S-box-containing protein